MMAVDLAGGFVGNLFEAYKSKTEHDFREQEEARAKYGSLFNALVHQISRHHGDEILGLVYSWNEEDRTLAFADYVATVVQHPSDPKRGWVEFRKIPQDKSNSDEQTETRPQLTLTFSPALSDGSFCWAVEELRASRTSRGGFKTEDLADEVAIQLDRLTSMRKRTIDF